jgi:hypothetical protein
MLALANFDGDFGGPLTSDFWLFYFSLSYFLVRLLVVLQNACAVILSDVATLTSGR